MSRPRPARAVASMALVYGSAGVLALAGCASGGGATGDGTASGPTTTTVPATTPVTPPTAPPGTVPSAAAARAEADERLLDAAGRGDQAGVREALADGANVHTANRDGETALVRAAYGNHLGVAEQLVAAGADVNRKDKTQQSPYLISTAEVGDDPRLLELTLAHGADVRSLDSWNGTGLIRAADRGFPRIIARLLAAGCPVDHVNRLGWTALHEAIILGDGSARYVEVVRLLVAAGADVDLASGRDGIRPLAHARSRGHTQIVELLRAAGAHE